MLCSTGIFYTVSASESKEMLSKKMVLLFKAIVKKSKNYAKLSGIKPDWRNDRLLCALKQCDQVIGEVENGFWRLEEKNSI